jgi:formate dehydrogenase major subunit
VSRLGTSEEFPFAATSYRLTEHFHYWTKHNPVNAALQPEFFVELSHELAALRGITPGGWVRVWSKRGSVKAKAVVTRRIQPLNCDGGRVVHVVGIPLHWGFTGAARKGWGPNTLSPFVGEANIETPGYKAFLVNIEPTTPPGAVS